MNTPRPNHTKRPENFTPPPPYIPLYDEFTGSEPKLIGWYNFATGVILTEHFNPSLGGSKSKPNLSHDRRARALDARVKAAQEEVAARESVEATADD